MDMSNISHMVIVLAIALGVTFISMVIHELMHGLTAYWLGDDTAKLYGRLTFNPIAHIDPWLTIVLPGLLVMANLGGAHMPIFGGAKPVPFDPHNVKGGDWGAGLVGLVGPLTNLVLAFICFAITTFVQPEAGSILGMILYYGVIVNLGFFAFNILPIPPLDGSRVLYAVAPEFIRRGMDQIERLGLLVVFAIVMLASPIISKLMMAIINGTLDGFEAVLSMI